jgi:hypothetical protein
VANSNVLFWSLDAWHLQDIQIKFTNEITVFRDVGPCSLVVLPMFLRCLLPPLLSDCKAQLPRRQFYSYSLRENLKSHQPHKCLAPVYFQTTPGRIRTQ